CTSITGGLYIGSNLSSKIGGARQSNFSYKFLNRLILQLFLLVALNQAFGGRPKTWIHLQADFELIDSFVPPVRVVVLPGKRSSYTGRKRVGFQRFFRLRY